MGCALREVGNTPVMPNLKITWEVAQQRHPEHVKNVMNRLQAGRSKERHRQAHELNWSYEWCVRCPHPKGIDGLLSAATIGLRGASGHWWASSTQAIQPVPPEIRTYYEELNQAADAEAAYLASLTPEQRRAKFNEALAILQQDPGFIHLRFSG